ncbi:hypothetical protein B566_EDAN015424 [Ephemera danica]|nr:hypothetical protein B566_EDAN015424 [Ephemera danica]
MPLDAAIQLITRNYDSFMKGGAVLVATNHPENISAMLQLLVQNRSLTVLQYDTILRYLSQRREQQVKLEVVIAEHSAPAPTPVPAPHPAQAEQLQKRIMSILDKKMTPAPVPAPSAAPQGKGIMQDPKVQMALSSLLGSGSFKNFGQRQ